ncbi:MAG TPA: EF-hand domain-containing protein [Albitalea sp.]|nr:EF-hand domain-containing protein [Albitalea sp.]
MPTRYLLPLTCLPVVLAGAALTAFAQTNNAVPVTEESLAAKDRVMIESAFAHADVNNDGKLSLAEAGKLPAVFAKFDRLDTNKDGVLSLEEFAAVFTAADLQARR